MTEQTQKQTPEAPKGSRPGFRAWLVQDTPEGEARWTELSGLWPTKSGKGFKGALSTPVAATEGRIVILPATYKPNQEAEDHETSDQTTA